MGRYSRSGAVDGATVERSMPNLTHQQGSVLLVLAAATFSFGGLAFRLTETANPWEYLFFRGLGMTLVTGAMFVAQNRRRLHVARSRFRPVHLLIGLVLASANALFIVSLEFATVAFVLFLQPVAPIAAAIFAWLLMRELMSRHVMLATVGVFGGIIVMVSGTLGDDVSPKSAFALGIPITFGLYAVLVRSAQQIDPAVPVIAAGAILMSTSLAITAASGGINVSGRDAAIGIFAGGILLGLPMALFNMAQRVVPAPEAMVLMMTEVLLAPVWVWLFVDETPAPTTIIGGLIILAAVAWLTMRRSAQNPTPALAHD